MRDVREALMVGRASDGRLVRRPMSPHLQIWRWPVTMATSILHRITGCGLGFGTVLMTWWLVAAATSDDAFATVQWFLGSWFGILCLFGWTACLVYHLINGLRHLAWDALIGFEKREYTLASYVIFAATIGFTLLIMIVGFAVR